MSSKNVLAALLLILGFLGDLTLVILSVTAEIHEWRTGFYFFSWLDEYELGVFFAICSLMALFGLLILVLDIVMNWLKSRK